MTARRQPTSPMRLCLQRLAAPICLAALSACAITSPGTLRIDTSLQAKSHSSRVEVLVLHYTSLGNEASLHVLTEQNVSSHYLITDETPPKVYRLVDESRRAWHAGQSQWYEKTGLNATSIGIEIVNAGKQGNAWSAYSPAQIDMLVLLLQDLISRHQIEPRNIVGHSDISIGRKIDPGLLFPWAELAGHGIGRWYDEDQVRGLELAFLRDGLPDAAWAQKQLRRLGYPAPSSGRWDAETTKVLAAFQMRYRPDDYSGHPDARTLAILKALP